MYILTSEKLYICNHCGEIFSEEEKAVFVESEYRGECWGRDSYEEMLYEECPHCHDDDIERYYPDEEDADTE